MKHKAALMAAGLALASPAAFAAVSDAEFQAMKEQLAALTQKLSELEADRARDKEQVAQAQTVAATRAPAPAAASWTERVTLSGDFRLRHDQIDAEGSDYQYRDRFRARPLLTAVVSDNVTVGFGLGSGDSNTPVSANQTLTGGFSDKDVWIDLAYVDWKALDDTHVIGGKFKNPFYRPGESQMIWDSDVRPEGFAGTYDNGTLFGTLAGLWAQESATSGNDVLIYGLQAGARFAIADAAKLTVGASYYDANDTKGEAFLYNTGNSYGNTAGPGGATYLYGYEEMEGFAQLAFRLFNRPLSVYFDYVKNNDADDHDTGWTSGLTLGETKAKGTWSVGYYYEDLESDAVLGVFTDSDFAGGGSDVKGSALQGAYALTDRMNLAGTYYLNTRGQDTASETDYNRFMLDVNFKY